MKSAADLIEEGIIYTFGDGEIDKAMQLARDYGLTDLVTKFENALAFKKDKESFKKHYEGDNGRQAGDQILHSLPDIRQFKAMEHIRALQAESLLDIGCADGSFVFFCLRENIVNRVMGIDPFIGGIEWANKYATEQFPNRARFMQGLIEDITLDPDYDVIYFGEILEHVLDPVQTIKKALSFSKNLKGVVITTPVGRPPLLEHEKTLVHPVMEHIRFIDESVLEGYCKETGLVMGKAERVGTGWVNLIVTLKPGEVG